MIKVVFELLSNAGEILVGIALLLFAVHNGLKQLYSLYKSIRNWLRRILWSRLDKHDEVLEDHEQRITRIEPRSAIEDSSGIGGE